jgi:hypothetical protein
MELAFFWFGFAFVCGVMASRAGRSGFGYFILACIISPLLCFLLLAVLGKAPGDGSPEPGAPTPETHVKCPDCRELVLKDARVCKHCHCRLIPQTETHR